MEGPWSIQHGIHLGTAEKARVQWVTGLETEVVDAAGQKPISQEFFCHSNLTFAERSGGPAKYNQEMGGKTHLDWRLFTLVPGRLSIDLPPRLRCSDPCGRASRLRHDVAESERTGSRRKCSDADHRP